MIFLIICSGLLHEVSEPRSLLSAIRRICKEETVVHIEVPNANSMHRLLGVEMSLIEDIYSKSENNIRLQQNTNFDMDQLKKIVEESGMKIIEEGSLFIKPFSHKQMGEMCKCGIIDEYVLDGLYNLTKYMPQFGSVFVKMCIYRYIQNRGGWMQYVCLTIGMFGYMRRAEICAPQCHIMWK